MLHHPCRSLPSSALGSPAPAPGTTPEGCRLFNTSRHSSARCRHAPHESSATHAVGCRLPATCPPCMQTRTRATRAPTTTVLVERASRRRRCGRARAGWRTFERGQVFHDIMGRPGPRARGHGALSPLPGRAAWRAGSPAALHEQSARAAPAALHEQWK